MPFEIAAHQWSDGLRRLESAPSDQRPLLERVTRAVEAGIRRQLGGPYTSEELADLYDEGTEWCSAIALDTAPDDSYAWDALIVVDAAFGRYLRGASDYAGGRRLG